MYPSFSGGQDNGMPLNACVKHVRQYGGRMEVLHMDYEVQHSLTTEYVGKVLLRTVMFWVFIAVAFLSRSVRLHPYTRDFEGLGILVYIWSRRYGGYLGTEVFDFYTSQMWDYKF